MPEPTFIEYDDRPASWVFPRGNESWERAERGTSCVLRGKPRKGMRWCAEHFAWTRGPAEPCVRAMAVWRKANGIPEPARPVGTERGVYLCTTCSREGIGVGGARFHVTTRRDGFIERIDPRRDSHRPDGWTTSRPVRLARERDAR